MALDDPHPLDRLGEAVDRLPGAAIDGVIGRIRSRRERHRRRRRTVMVASAVTVVLAAGAAAVVIPNLGDDGAAEVRTADGGAAVALPTVPDRAVAVAARGPWVWVLTQDQEQGEPSDRPSTLVRVDAETLAVTATVELGVPAEQLLVTDDAVWATGVLAEDLLRIDPDTAEVVESVPLRLERPRACEPACAAGVFEPNSLAEAGGRIWVGTRQGEAVAVDPATSAVEDRIGLEVGLPGDSAGTADTFWVTALGLGVLGVDTRSGEVVHRFPVTLDGVQQNAFAVDVVGDHLLVTVADPRQGAGGTERSVLLEASTGALTRAYDQVVGGVAPDGDTTWVVDGATMRRVTSAAELAAPDVGTVHSLGLPRPAAATQGAYWYLPDARTLARVDPDAAVQTVEVVRDPSQEPAPVSECPDADHPTGPVGADALPNAGATSRAHVQAVVDDSGTDVAEDYGARSVRVVPRDGYVFLQQGELVDIVRADDDWQVEVVLASSEACPSAPLFLGGADGRVPVIFTVEGSGPTVPSADEAAIEAVFLQWLDAGEDVDAIVAAVEDGEALRATIGQALATAPASPETYTGEVDSIAVDPPLAAVRFRIVRAGSTVTTEDGNAIRVEDRWLVSRETYCATIAIGPIRCPPR